jgi:hypothetical protein
MTPKNDKKKDKDSKNVGKRRHRKNALERPKR